MADQAGEETVLPPAPEATEQQDDGRGEDAAPADAQQQEGEAKPEDAPEAQPQTEAPQVNGSPFLSTACFLTHW